MITTNLPALVKQLSCLAPVRVHDHLDTITITLPATANMAAVDDLACDALFADPMNRILNTRGWTLEFGKRDKLRNPSDLHTRTVGKVVHYHMEAA